MQIRCCGKRRGHRSFRTSMKTKLVCLIS